MTAISRTTGGRFVTRSMSRWIAGGIFTIVAPCSARRLGRQSVAADFFVGPESGFEVDVVPAPDPLDDSDDDDDDDDDESDDDEDDESDDDDEADFSPDVEEDSDPEPSLLDFEPVLA